MFGDWLTSGEYLRAGDNVDKNQKFLVDVREMQSYVLKIGTHCIF